MAAIEEMQIEQQIRRSTTARLSTKHLETSISLQNPVKETEEAKLEEVLKKIYQKELEHQDGKNISLHPSYSKFELPYLIKCRNRYNASKNLYEQRFQYEVQQLIAQQPTGYEAARLNRHLCITTMWPPLHSLCEIAHTKRYFFSVTHKQRKRLNWIMSTEII